MHSFENKALQILGPAAARGALAAALKDHDWKKFPAVIVLDERDGSQRVGAGEFKTMERLYWNRTGLHAQDPRPAKVRIYEHGELVVFDSCENLPPAERAP